MIGNGLTNTDTPVENGLSHKEDFNLGNNDVHSVAARVVENVVKLASEAAEEANSRNASPKVKRCVLKSLPTIQIDTVPSPLSSPTEPSPASTPTHEKPLDSSEIEISLQDEQVPENFSENLRDSLKDYIEDLLSKAMVVAEKKINFADFDKSKENEEEQEEGQQVTQSNSTSQLENKPTGEPPNDDEIVAAAEKLVEEVLTKAQDVVIEQMEQFEKEIAALEFPITFDEAPECVKEVAAKLVKEVVGNAIAQAEEKAVPTVPFNFEDVDLMKTNGPWYIRVREALVRVLRTACFCTPRRSDS